MSFERNPRGRSTRGAWGRKEEEYIADFELVSRRCLDPIHYKVFRYYFLLGADWRLCCKRLRIDRGNLFHAIYRIEERLGKAFYETEPYALFPPNDYFVTRRLDPGEVTGTVLLNSALEAANRLPRRRIERTERLSA